MQKLNKSEWVAVVIAIIIVGYFFFFFDKKEQGKIEVEQPLVSEEAKEIKAPEDLGKNVQTDQIKNDEVKVINTKPKTNMNELKIETIKEGTGSPITVGQTAEVNYTGKLLDGTVFDSSIPRGQTFEFRLGEGRVIAGWEEGVKGMKVGEKRLLTIPGNMAYGSNGVPNGKGGFLIPPNATLMFEVDLVSIK